MDTVHHNHIANNHEGLKKFICDTCGKAFAVDDSLKRHILQVHEGIKNHKCEFCGKSFVQSGTLNRHIQSVHYQR